MLKIEEILKTIETVYPKYGIKKATLFGSYAHGTAKEDSDVDILIEFYEKQHSFNNQFAFQNELEEILSVGVAVYSGDTLTQKDESYWQNYPDGLNNTINADTIKIFIGHIMQYGWTGYNNVNWSSSNSGHADEMANLFATQYLIWEAIVGERDESFNKVDASIQGRSNILSILSSSHPLYSRIMEHYDRIVASVISHTKLPSFIL